MTKPIKPTFKRYIVVGGEPTFTYPFQLDAATDVQVFRTRDGATVTLSAGVDFEVNDLGNPNGGTITPLSPQLPLVIDDIWSLLRIQSVDRLKDFNRRGPFKADVVNPQFQKLVRNYEDVERDANEAIRQDRAILTGLNPSIPQPVDRRSLIFIEDQGGDFSMEVSAGDLDNKEGDLQDALDAAFAASLAANVAQISAGSAFLSESDAQVSASDANTTADGVDALYKEVIIFSVTPTLAQNGFAFNVDTGSFPLITLPTAAALGSADYRVCFTKTNIGADMVFDAPGSSTINGSASNFVLADRFALTDAVYDGAEDDWTISARTGQDERIVQIKAKPLSSVVTGDQSIPQGDGIPLSSQGFQVLDITFTPVFATSRINIKCFLVVSTTRLLGNAFTIALFRDNTAEAVAASANETAFGTFTMNPSQGSATREMRMLSITADIPATSTDETTIKVRIGWSENPATLTVNGQGGVRRFGGKASSIIVIKEYELG